MRRVAQKFKVTLRTVQRWVRRAAGKRPDRVDWSERPRGTRVSPRRTPAAMEDLVLTVRVALRDKSALGDFGAQAILRALETLGQNDPPSVRTINRILARRGVLDGRARVRRPAPPAGWYLPRVAACRAGLDSFDFVEGLVIQGGPEVDVLTGISLHGGLPTARPMDQKTSRKVVDALIAHWAAFGCPSYAQYDNDALFQGPHNHPDSFGRVTRLCLSLGIIPVFTTPRDRISGRH